MSHKRGRRLSQTRRALTERRDDGVIVDFHRSSRAD